MSMLLLRKIQQAADRYAAARKELDAATERGDIIAQTLHWARLREADREWKPLAEAFTNLYDSDSFPILENTTVVWRRGAVGLQGICTSGAISPQGLCWVATKRGVFADYADNLMPLSAVEE